MNSIRLLAVAAVMAAAGFVGSAQAAPFSPAPVAVVSEEATVERVAGGCGWGYHPNPWGMCRPNGYGPRYGYYGPRPFYRPSVYGYGYRGHRRFF